MSDSNSRVGLIAMTAAVVAFSLSTPIVKWAAVTGVVLAFWRMWMSVATWWGYLLVAKRPLPDRRTWTLVAPAGLFFGLNISLLFTAVTKTSIAHAEFIATMTPLLVVPLGAVVFDERPNWSALRFGLISLVGVTFVLFFGTSGGTATLAGDLIMLLVLCSWTSYLLFTKRARAAGVDTVSFMACMMPLGLITTIPMAVLIAGDEIFAMSARGWLVAAGLAVLTGMVAHGCVAFAQQHLPIATITIMQTAQPALAVFFAFLILGEAVQPLQVVGMVLVLIGITAFTRASQRRTPPQPPPPPTVTNALGTRS
ncbi:DMT family transporter [Ilumatobacter nonamiensis]|uniref:DMT family transporter n=1 Tax=Ilumatobacter nonamiensis TaxID=467093 RepID=UPI000346A525|nr:DMT family transporter [Ilumatobacter nonamiensis]